MTQESEYEKEERLRWKSGTREILETPDRREVIWNMLDTHGLWGAFHGLSDMTRDEAIGAHNAGVLVLNGLRTLAPELVALMINEAAQRETRDHERSSGDAGKRSDRPRFVAVGSK